ncbi:putative plasma membrane protein [Phytophthora palmivora]|uniref:Plasma membrane protein n=1 Tax=Phytophthora palmivora TaxID=4796 RepID=A0A2P4X4D7_9STRA|nr:putative plasma membrane protein [Phytophthora palmivora]
MSFASFPAPPSDDELDTQLYTMIELEGNRYRAFFAKLSGSDGSISRDAALEFFRKSSLSEEQVQELYSRLKGLQLLRDGDHMNETEFVMGMHFIVCMTKRNLVKIPPNFPIYLFPTLDLTPERRPSFNFPTVDQSDATKMSSVNNPHIAFDQIPHLSLPNAGLDARETSKLQLSHRRSIRRDQDVVS